MAAGQQSGSYIMAPNNKNADKNTSEENDAGLPDIVPSALDDNTHAEMRALYAESTKTLRFVKTHQWKTLGSTLLTFLGLIFIAGFIGADKSLTQKLMAITILMTTSVIFTLIIYQFWMHNEARKIDALSTHMSSLFQEIRAIKSKREGNLHRYTLLIFMITCVVFGAIVVHLSLAQVAGG